MDLQKSIGFKMAPITTILLLGLCAFPHFSYGLESPNINEFKWSHEILLSKGVEVKWQISDPEWLTLQISAPTTGYLSLGFSPNGGMRGADMVVGWVDSEGVAHLKDCHSIDKITPILDSKQDYELLSGHEANGRTTILFRRKWNTCDEEDDFIIGNSTTHMIWAWHKDDPKLHPKFEFNYHGADNRGVKGLFIRSPPKPRYFPDDKGHEIDGVKTWDIIMDEAVIDGTSDTVYLCKILKFPILQKKHHMIGFRPIIQPQNIANVHHITVYHCHAPEYRGSTEKVFEHHVGTPESECYGKNMPPDWGQHCYGFLFGWVLGGEGELLPQHVGSPLGDTNGDTTYFKLEIHYDNPKLLEFKDNSGVRVFYTDKLREFDSSTAYFGYRFTPFLMVPPGQPKFNAYSMCSRLCTREGIPETGIKILSVLHHAHLFARKLKLRHIRNGKELPLISEDNNYDFDFQDYKILDKEVTVLPGDDLLVECEYDTTKLRNITFGGIGTAEEMCLAMIVYYPRSALMDCRSQPELYSFFNALGVKQFSGSYLSRMHYPYSPDTTSDPYLTNYIPQDDAYHLEALWKEEQKLENPFGLLKIPFRGKEQRGDSVIDNLDWNDTKFVYDVQESWKNGKHYVFCGGTGSRRIKTKGVVADYPKFIEREQLNQYSTCPNKLLLQKSNTASSHPAYSIVPILGTIMLTNFVFNHM